VKDIELKQLQKFFAENVNMFIFIFIAAFHSGLCLPRRHSLDFIFLCFSTVFTALPRQIPTARRKKQRTLP
jgi:hypothetical protein